MGREGVECRLEIGVGVGVVVEIRIGVEVAQRNKCSFMAWAVERRTGSVSLISEVKEALIIAYPQPLHR